MTYRLSILTATAAAAAIAGCAAPPTGSQSGSYHTAGLQAQMVRLATIEAIRPVTLNKGSETSYAAMGFGGAIGGVVGNSIGKGNGRTIAQISGVAAGAAAGNAIASAAATVEADEITVRDERGQMLVVVQERDAYSAQLRIGARVRLIESAGKMRVAL